MCGCILYSAYAGKPHGMLSIVGLEDRTIETLCREALEGCPAGTVCQLANYLFPQVARFRLCTYTLFLTCARFLPSISTDLA